MLAPGQDRGRRRFSLAHELGHFHIPTHASVLDIGPCADPDMRARSTDAKVVEWEANDFASELLMPRRLFATDVAKIDISIAQAQKLAAPDMYDVSLTAAAWRMVQVSREPCALVVATRGRVEWAARSTNFPYSVTEKRQQLHPESLAAGAFRGEGDLADPIPVPAAAWLENGILHNGELVESCRAIPRLNQALSLLWIVGVEDEERGAMTEMGD